MNAESAQKRIAFGYNRGPINQIELNVGQANVIKLIFAWYLEGKSLSQIADMLEGIGVPTAQNKRKWGRQVLSNILSNRHYTGQDTVYPPLVSLEDFERVQTIKQTRCN